METTREMTNLLRAHRTPPSGMAFHDSIELVRGDLRLLGYISVVERAWREMGLAGVLCMDNRPILYLKVFDQPSSPPERIKLQTLFWNQGVANILVVADPVSVYIYSGLAKPSNESQDEDNDEALIETLDYKAYIQRIQSFQHSLATGRYYSVHQKHFEQSESVDALLLDNLRSLRDALISGDEKMEIQNAHAFIGRILFLCYLLDRGIVSLGDLGKISTGTMLLANLLEGKPSGSQVDFLYGLFHDLKEKFNGNMFDQDLDTERLLISPFHLQKLTLFLGGHLVGSGQRTLGFWPYNFKMIPVETISAIYQDFLSAEDPEGQEKSGAYYTPRFLAEMVVDLATFGNPDAMNWSFLDPACGSGVFLVILFNRLASRWVLTHPHSGDYETKAKALQTILARQIRGIDKAETSCRIACFSLYLAYLDFFDPPDIRAYTKKTGRPLPKLLDYGDTPHCPSADIPVIHKGDSLAEGTLLGETFDCLIGNPPWEGRQSKQLAQKFLEKAPSFLRSGGTGCLLLPSKILQNQTDAFQAKWLKEVTLKRVVQLADYRFLLFQDALCPAFIAHFMNIPPQPAVDMVEFSAPKFNRNGLRKGVITFNPTDRTWIPLSDIILASVEKEAPLLWKRRLWGTPRDQKLLDLLGSFPPLHEHVDLTNELRKRRLGRTKRWVAGQGIKPWPEKAKTAPDRMLKEIKWVLDSRFIETASWNSNLFVLHEDTIALEERFRKKRYRTDVLYSQPPEELFSAPLVLVSQGFGKVAFCEFNVLFQHSLQAISGPALDADLLMFLSAYLRSNLAKYFLFHTSANWGTERDKVHLFELLRVPFPLPADESVSQDASRIISEVTSLMKDLRSSLQIQLDQCRSTQTLFDACVKDKRGWNKKRRKLIDELQEKVEPLIYRYFGLTEQEMALVEDTVRVFIPSSTPTTLFSAETVSLEPVEHSRVAPYSEKGLQIYADTLTKTLNSWAEAEGSSYRIRAEGGTDEQTGLAMVTLMLTQAESAFRRESLTRRLAGILDKLHADITAESETLSYRRDLMAFLGDKIHIVRPDILLNWTRTAALNDAARIFGDIALAGKGCR